MILYVVRRAFKSRGVLLEAGEVIDDPSAVSLFRSRVGSRDILELTPGDPKNAMWLNYFSTRVKKPLDPRVIAACTKTEAEKPKVVKAPKQEAPQQAPAAPVKPAAKPVVKAVAKPAVAKPAAKAAIPAK